MELAEQPPCFSRSADGGVTCGGSSEQEGESSLLSRVE